MDMAPQKKTQRRLTGGFRENHSAQPDPAQKPCSKVGLKSTGKLLADHFL